MSWIRKSPFRDQNEAIENMVDMLSAEANVSGLSLNSEEKKILSTECSIPSDLREKSKSLIREILLKEKNEHCPSAKSFGDSLEWAGDGLYPSIARLTEEVIIEGRASGIFPPPAHAHGWGRVKDKALLISCGLLVVLAMFVVGILFSK